MIEIKSLYKKFGKNEVLKGMDLSVSKGGVFAILGPNGSGKTTLIKCILGMVIPDAGEILVNDEPVIGKWKYREQIDYLPQIANFPENLTVKELIEMIKDIRRVPTREEALIERFGLKPFWKKKIGTLSGGTKQKVNIVLSFMFDSDIIMLDEPTVGLDPIALITLKELIQERKNAGKTVLITSHILSFVEQVSEGIVFILEGKIYFKGSVEELKEFSGENDLEHAIANLLRKSHA